VLSEVESGLGRRAVMREVLQKELERVLALRGLRTRQWVIEWDESALDFLLEKGFSPALGARPLRRAIQRHIEDALSEAFIRGRIRSGQPIAVGVKDGALWYQQDESGGTLSS